MKLGISLRTSTTSKTARKTARTSSTVLGALMVLGLVVFMATPALAHHNADHTQGGGNDSVQQSDHEASDHDGDADSDSSTSYTEDNDSNDGTANNVADEGDNAHPSGKDRSVENGGSSTQGKAESNPDDSKGPMRYEGGIGDDKANGPGGSDLADQDGNNGCGNDDDFDDDNNGHCGRPEATLVVTTTPPSIEDEVLPDTEDKTCEEIMGSREACDDDVLGRTDKATPEVLGEMVRNATPAVAAAPAVKGAVLPFTGTVDLMFATAIALLLIAAGIISLKLRNE